jgi:hypothetical protein
MHWDGTSWSLVNAATLADAAGLGSLKAFASDDVWAVGSKDGGNGFTGSTFTLHWDGTAWSEIPSPNVDEFSGLVGVDGASPNDVWAVGTSCGVNGCNYLALHWDGAVWTVVPTPVQNNTSEFYALAAVSSTNVVAVGRSDFIPSSARWDGKQWNVVPTPPLMNTFGYLLSVSERNGSLWAVGYQDFKEIQEDDLIFNWTR